MDNPFKPTEKYSAPVVAITFIFAFVSIAFLTLLDKNIEYQLIVASFGSTAVLIYVVPKAAFSQPKNVFFGNIFSSALSILIVYVFKSLGLFDGCEWLCFGLCVSLSILLMMFTGTIHPPAGATSLTIAIGGITDPAFLVFPLAIGLIVMMILAYGAVYLRDRYTRTDS